MPTYEPMLDPSEVPSDGRTADELRLIAGLRAGDESVFLEAVDRYHRTMVRMAMHFTPSRDVAEDAAVEAWSRLVSSVDHFGGCSSLRAWLLGAVICCARRRSEEIPSDDLPVAPSQRGDSPSQWGEDAWDRLVSEEGRSLVSPFVAGLPHNQREVVVLYDVFGLSATDVGDILDLSEPAQRALLHRGRTTIRSALDAYLRP